MKTVTTIHAAVSAWVLCVCWSGVSSIRVKFGTNDGPIVPPTPTPSVAPVPPFRAPAPVWEDRRDDLPDPNATWRPLFVPNPLYTRVNYNPAPPLSTAAPVQSSAQRFVSAYLPKPPAAPAPAPAPAPQPSQPATFYKAAPVQQPGSAQGAQLSSHNVPGLGIRYFVPVYRPVERQEQTDAQEDKQNHIDNDSVSQQPASAHDTQLNYDKESTRRARHSHEASHNVVPVYQYQYQWPVYVPYRHQ